MTFEQFGQVLEVYQRPPPVQNHPSVAFEVTFQKQEDAAQSIDKFDGALADGRILGVHLKNIIGDPRDPGHQSMQSALAAADLQRRGGDASKELLPGPSPLPRGPEAYKQPSYQRESAPYAGSSNGSHSQYTHHGPPPTGPRAAAQHQNSGPKNHHQSQHQPHHQNGKGKAPMIPTGPKASTKPQVPPNSNKPLAARLLTPEQAKKQALKEAEKKRKAAAQAQALLWAKQKGGNKVLPGGKRVPLGKAGVAGTRPLSTSLKDRLGSLPLAQRLAAESLKAVSKSDATFTAAEKEKKAAKVAKLKAKKAAKKSEKTAAGGDGMEVDL